VSDPVRVVRAVTRARQAAFLNLPWTIYRGDPNWVPPLRASVRELIDVRHHPFYGGGRYGEIELYLAYDGTEVVGRVAAILNHSHDRFHDERVVFFGFFECVERAEVAAALLAAVEGWGSERGATVVRGPMNPSTNYECGLLVQGHERPPVLMMTYNPAYYEALLEAAGLAKAMDLYAYTSSVHDSNLERVQRLAERARRRNPGLTTRGANLKDLHGEVRQVQEIYNAAWEKNWGFVPFNDGEIAWLAKELKPLVQPDLLRFAFIDGEPVAFLLAVPDWNPVLADLDGSPWRHPLRTLKHLLTTGPEDMEGLRLITLGVKETCRKRGIEGVLFAEGIAAALELGYQWCEYSWILEDNELTKRAVRLMNGELYKTYRVYEKPF
jgi:hypothetical protein